MPRIQQNPEGVNPAPEKKAFGSDERNRVRMSYERRVWLIERLRDSDGPTYSELIGELFEATRHVGETERSASIRCVRAVRSLLWNRLAVTEPDETVWLTPRGWEPKRLAEAKQWVFKNRPVSKP
jgi:hypothetical protein